MLFCYWKFTLSIDRDKPHCLLALNYALSSAETTSIIFSPWQSNSSWFKINQQTYIALWQSNSTVGSVLSNLHLSVGNLLSFGGTESRLQLVMTGGREMHFSNIRCSPVLVYSWDTPGWRQACRLRLMKNNYVKLNRWHCKVEGRPVKEGLSCLVLMEIRQSYSRTQASNMDAE